MLSYRHAFHAGNHADVLKHMILLQLARYLGGKEKPFWYIDTHAGAGRYALDSGFARRKSEYAEGIGRLWHREDLPQAVSDYVSLVRGFNPDGRLRVYPGSVLFALSALREDDRLRLFERHSNEVRILRNTLKTAGRRVLIAAGDGFAGLKAFLPPPPRRALTLIDPSYEEKQDYERVVQVMKDAWARFPGGVYAIWYPCLARREAQALPLRLARLAGESWLCAELCVSRAPREGWGLYGSGVFVFNPPWTLHETLSETLPWLSDALATHPDARFTLERGTAASKARD